LRLRAALLVGPSAIRLIRNLCVRTLYARFRREDRAGPQKSRLAAARQDGLQVIDILAHHPSTAKFISRETGAAFLWLTIRPQALVDRMAQTFTKTDGDLRAVLKTMFASPEFFLRRRHGKPKSNRHSRWL